MTVAQLQHSISPAEYVQWRAFYVWRNARMELAAKEATINARTG